MLRFQGKQETKEKTEKTLSVVSVSFCSGSRPCGVRIHRGRRKVFRPNRGLSGLEGFQKSQKLNQSFFLGQIRARVGKLAFEGGHNRLPAGDDLRPRLQNRLAQVGLVGDDLPTVLKVHNLAV